MNKTIEQISKEKILEKLKLVDIKYKFISYHKNGSIKNIFYETNHHMYYVKKLGDK